MEVKIREKCSICKGSGTNGKTELEIIETRILQDKLAPPKMKYVEGFGNVPESHEEMIRRSQKCANCNGRGYFESWKPLNALSEHIQK